MHHTFKARGVIVPLLTPFDGDGERLDEEALRRNIEWLIARGVNGFMPGGTTGETALLSHAERRRVVEITVEAVNGRVPILAHVGAPSTSETIDLARHAVAQGADAISVVTPWYYLLPDDALVEHFVRVAAAVPATPVFLYNIPHNANNTITRGVAERIIARAPNVIGIKDSAGSLASLQSFVGLRDGTFQVICGSDLLQYATLEAGGVAGVSGNANVVPEILVALFTAWDNGESVRAADQQLRLTEALQAMGNGGSLALFKAIGAWRGLRMGSVRAPLPPASPQQIENAIEKLSALGIAPARERAAAV